MTEILKADVLVVGGGTGGTAAAIQAARCGVNTILVSEFPWLGGMLTAAGVTAPDGNELAAFQTGLWGAFLRQLEQRQPEGLDHAWVSFFTYEPAGGAAIFADWVAALPNLEWRWGHCPQAVLRQGDRVTGVAFSDFTIEAQITLDGTELGDVLALGEVPYRWGWESQSQWQEPSAPASLCDPDDPLAPIVQRYPVQSPTYVVVLQDFQTDTAPQIAAASSANFSGTWADYGADTFLNYGRLPGHRFMLNWPQQGNDYGVDLQRLVLSEANRREYQIEAKAHSQQFAQHIQQQLGHRYGLAEGTFPTAPGWVGGGAFALHPYYRESRRLVGLETVTENDILPVAAIAPLPVNAQGQVSAIAIGNYANDHHYPDFQMPLAPKSIRWGGRWTGTPFTIPYGALVPEQIDGLLACDKNISVSHIANGATRLQPVVMNIGQAAGMAAALCVQTGSSPRQLPVRQLQLALLQDTQAPAAVVPHYDLIPSHPDWLSWQLNSLDNPGGYLNPPVQVAPMPQKPTPSTTTLEGHMIVHAPQNYALDCDKRTASRPASLSLVTLQPWVNRQLLQLTSGTPVRCRGTVNRSGNWLLLDNIEKV